MTRYNRALTSTQQSIAGLGQKSSAVNNYFNYKKKQYKSNRKQMAKHKNKQAKF